MVEEKWRLVVGFGVFLGLWRMEEEGFCEGSSSASASPSVVSRVRFRMFLFLLEGFRKKLQTEKKKRAEKKGGGLEE